MAYIDPITGAYVEDSLSALPPGYNQPKSGNEANVAKMRAQLNSEEALRQQQATQELKSQYSPEFINNIKLAMQRMPGAGFVQGVSSVGSDMLGGFLGNLYGVGKQALSGELGNPVAGNQAYADVQKLAQKFHYTPPSKTGREFAEGINKLGEFTGPLPELMSLQPGRRFTPDDLRVAGKTAVEDVRNFPMDYANAREGVTRDYPTMGSRAAEFTDLSANIARPLAEKAYDMYMNPQSSVEVSGLKPGANLTGLFEAGSPMYAVKPKGGNWPTNLGSTNPLSEQGALGKHLSEVQYNDPVAAFQKQLEKHYERGIDNRQLSRDFEDYLNGYISVHANGIGFSDPNGPAMQALKKEAADKFAEAYNAGTIGAADIEPTDKKLHTASQIEQTLPLYNAWVMGPYQKYITNQMATGLETDPLLQVVNESGMPVNEIFGIRHEVPSFTQDSGEERRRSFVNSMTNYGTNASAVNALENSSVGKVTATTPEGITYENLLDMTLYPKGPYAFEAKEGFPVSAKLDDNALITDFLNQPLDETGFSSIRKKVFQDLMSGNLDPNKISNVTPATITRQMIKDKMAEFKEHQLSKKGAAEWIPKRAAQMPTDMAFDDGSKMTIITPEMANADEAMTARDLGQITIDLNQCVGAGCHGTQDYPGHGPFLVPHTGKPPRGKVEPDKYGYLRRLKNSEIEIASLKDPEGVSQVTLELKLDKPKALTNSNKVHAIGIYLENNYPQDAKEFFGNLATFGSEKTIENAIQLHPEIVDLLAERQAPIKKSVLQLKGKNNGEIEEAYVPHMLQWLNQNAANLTSVREISHLPNAHDLDNHYDAIGKLVDERPSWYSPTVEEFFKKADDERLLPRFFTTKDFAQLAEQYGVDLASEPPKKLSDWDKQTLREEVYSVLVKDPNSLYLQDNLKDDYIQNLDILFGDRKPEGEIPVDVHRKLADMLLDHNGKYRDQLVSALGQLSDARFGNMSNGWLYEFTEPQISNMLNIMAGWFERHPMEKLPTNADFETTIAKHPRPFNEINIPESPWHPSENDLVNTVRNMEPEVAEITPAIMELAYDNLLQIIPERWNNAFVDSLNDNPISRRALHDDILARPAEYEINQFPENIRQIIANSILHLGMNRPPNAHFR